MTKQKWHILTSSHGLIRNIVVMHSSLPPPIHKQAGGREPCASYSRNFYFFQQQLDTKHWFSRIGHIKCRMQSENFCTPRYAFCRQHKYCLQFILPIQKQVLYELYSCLLSASISKIKKTTLKISGQHLYKIQCRKAHLTHFKYRDPAFKVLCARINVSIQIAFITNGHRIPQSKVKTSILYSTTEAHKKITQLKIVLNALSSFAVKQFQILASSDYLYHYSVSITAIQLTA